MTIIISTHYTRKLWRPLYSDCNRHVGPYLEIIIAMHEGTYMAITISRYGGLY
jgi:hypothetical protein